MKDKITYLILGILIGAVITSGCFLIFSKTQDKGMMRGERPEGFEEFEDGERRGRKPEGNFVMPENLNEDMNSEIDSNVSNTTTE